MENFAHQVPVKPEPDQGLFARVIAPMILGLSLLLIYLLTAAPGLTWANAGADGGDLLTAAAVGGVAHPSGYPTYLLMAGLFQRLPIGTLAFRTTLLSALAAALAAVLVYVVLVRLPASPARGNAWAGLAAGWMFGLAPLTWSQAVITEVYTLHALFGALVLLLAVWIPAVGKSRWWDGVMGAVLGLAAGNHLSALFYAPPALLHFVPGTRRPDLRALARGLGGMAAGLLVYAALPLRALGNPPVNWGDPTTPGRLWWLVSGQLYQRRIAELPLEGLLLRLREGSALMVAQFEWAGLALALAGLLLFFRPARLLALSAWNALVFSLFALLYTTTDSYLYLLPVVMSVALWAGLGLDGLMHADLPHRRWMRAALVGLLGVWLVLAAVERWPLVDASRDTRAEDFAARVMVEAPPDAILLAEGDRAVFALWYAHFALHQRPDVIVIASDLLHYEWYNNVLRATYPQAAWPEELFWPQTVAAANPQRPVCRAVWDGSAVLTCGEIDCCGEVK